ncbi:MarR family transcriptional regulator [Streptacidiphilus sp. PAMC 29251]
MSTTPAPRRYACVNAEGVLADLDLVPVAYRVLLKIRAFSSDGGLLHLDQAAIAKMCGLSRATVNGALRDLDLAQILTRVRNGSYQLNPMLASYRTVEECEAAIEAMPATQKLTHKDFVQQYRLNLERYQDQLAEQRLKRQLKAEREAAAISERRNTMRTMNTQRAAGS